jgi:hypothetical protein
MTTPKRPHPTEATPEHPLDQPATEATLRKVMARLQLTEREALSLADAPTSINDDLLYEALKVNLHGIADAYSEPTVEHLRTDPKLETSPHMAGFETAAERVRTISSAIDKLLNLVHLATAEARLDASQLQALVYDLIPQLRGRARSNALVRTIYATLFAYHHARHPGHGPVAAEPAPAAPAVTSPAITATSRSA